MSGQWTTPLPGGVPSTHKEHTESRTTILLPNDHSAFLNPPQQFNRDMSVAVIRAWNERRIEEATKKFHERQAKGKGRAKKGGKPKGAQKQETGEVAAEPVATATAIATETNVQETTEEPIAGPSKEPKYTPRNIKILEALSATGLRAIRYAKEIPNVKYVLANDLSPSACDAMRMNVTYNGVQEVPAEPQTHSAEAAKQNGNVDNATDEVTEEKLTHGRRPGCKGKVRVTEGDACNLMYSHRDISNRVDVVDLDPYGTAAPFIDAAVSCIADGGLLCVTCTDSAVLAGSQYPEKAYANYGGASVNAEYCHEVGLRLVLNMLATTAARYGRTVTPLLSFSIDFYVRLFVTIDTAPRFVKEVSSKIGIVYVCGYCQSSEAQPFGRVVEKKGHPQYKTAQKTSPGQTCENCGTMQHVGGPMWLGPIQDHQFAERCLESIKGQEGDYKTWTRMHGMLLCAREELDEMFYFTCNKISSFFRSSSAPSVKMVSALLNAGYKVSRSHASAGSIKTNAPTSFVYDVMREYIKTTPVRMDKIPDGNPARTLLAKEQTHKIDFTPHPDFSKFEKGEKVVFYQVNPLPNWGPASRAITIKSNAKAADNGTVDDGKRKAEGAIEEMEVKKAKVETLKTAAEVEEEEAMNL